MNGGDDPSRKPSGEIVSRVFWFRIVFLGDPLGILLP